MKQGTATGLATLCTLVFGAMNVSADEFAWQGQVNDGGSPAEGVYDLKYRLYDVDTGGAPLGLGELLADDVFIAGGSLSIKLDFGANTFDGNDRWLEVDIKADADVSYTTLAPRQKVDPTPYAHHAKKADQATEVVDGGLPATYSGAIEFTNPGNTFAGNGSGLTKLDASELATGIIPNPRLSPDVVRTIGATFTGQVDFNGGMTGDASGLTNLDWEGLINVPAGFADGVDNDTNVWSLNGSDLFYNTGNVGIGTNSPGYRLHVACGEVQPAGFFHATAPSGISIGVRGQSDSTSGGGVFGYATSTSGITYGVRGLSTSSSGTGLLGEASNALGETNGVLGISYSYGGRGVVGLATSATGWTYGVYGESTAGIGVYGLGAYGVSGESSNSSGRGVLGTATSITGINYGVQGNSHSSSGRGVYGYASSGSGTNYGVYGDTNSSDGYAGYFTGGRNYFEGNVGIGLDAPTSPLHIAGNVDPVALFQSAATSGETTAIAVSGARSAFTTGNTAYLDLRNFDEDEGVSGTDYSMARIGAGMADIAGQTGFLRFQVADGTGLQECMRITKNGLVGIGTSSPQADLHIDAPGSSTGSVQVGSPSGVPGIIGFANNGNRRDIRFSDGGIQLLTSASSSIPGSGNGLVINEGGGLAVGGDLDVSGDGTFTGAVNILGNLLIFETTADNTIAIENADDIIMRNDTDNDSTAWFRWFTDGNLYEQMRIGSGDEATILGDGLFVSNGIDYAEAFKTSDPSVEAGDVVCLVPGDWERIGLADREYDALSVGVVSTKPAFLAGMSFDQEDAMDPELTAQRDAARAAGDTALAKELTIQMNELMQAAYRPVALVGRVPCKVDAQYGPIMAGDRVTTSPTPGHAMLQTEPGPSIGIALEDQVVGVGSILVFVQPGWHGLEQGVQPGSLDGRAMLTDSAVRQQQDERIATLEQQNASLEARLVELENLIRQQ